MENPSHKDIKIKKVIHNKYTLAQKIAVVNEAEKTSYILFLQNTE